MKNFLKNIWLAVILAVIYAPVAWSQHTLGSSTLSAAVDRTTNTITISADTTDGVDVDDIAFVDREAMKVTTVSGTTLTVNRGVDGTQARPHTSGETIYIDKPRYFGLPFVAAGSCTSTTELVLPRIDTATGEVYRCTNSEWDREIPAARLKTKLDLHMVLDTTSDDRQVRINSRNFSTITSGSSIGFQSKPAQNVTTTGSVIGGEISPRVNNTFTAANVIGLHVDAYLRGTTARTVSGDVRGQQIELVTDDAATNTVSGNVVGLRFRAAFSATTLTGIMVPIRIETAETQTNSQQWDYALDLTGTNTAWSDTDTASGDTEAGFIRVRINGNTRRIVTYSDES